MTYPQPSTEWQEVIQPGEAEQFQAFVHQINRMEEIFARRGDGQLHRGFHRKPHAALNAEFRVLEDIPEYAKHGVFKEPTTYRAYVRFSNGFPGVRPDNFPDLLGFAVKLMGVKGPKLLEGQEDVDTQDFLALNVSYVPSLNTQEFITLSVPPSINLFTSPFKLIWGLGIKKSLKVMVWGLRTLRPIKSLAQERYYGLLPLKIGPYAFKYKWIPKNTFSAKYRPFAHRHYLRREFKERLKQEDIRFDFLAQFYVEEDKTPIEQGAKEWKEEDAPFVKLAELVIRKRDLDTSTAREQERHIINLSFNPWHAIEDHRPLGNAQRGRRIIYDRSSLYWGRRKDPTSSDE